MLQHERQAPFGNWWLGESARGAVTSRTSRTTLTGVAAGAANALRATCAAACDPWAAAGGAAMTDRTSSRIKPAAVRHADCTTLVTLNLVSCRLRFGTIAANHGSYPHGKVKP